MQYIFNTTQGTFNPKENFEYELPHKKTPSDRFSPHLYFSKPPTHDEIMETKCIYHYPNIYAKLGRGWIHPNHKFWNHHQV